MNDMDRKTFLRNAAAAAGTLAVAPSGLARLPAQETDRETLSSVPRPTLRVAGGDFGFPSPFAYVSNPGYARMSLIYDTLLWEDGSGRLLPWLAKGYHVSHDALIHTFELRTDVKWHDGRPLTAEDVVFTFRYFDSHVIPPVVVARPPLGIAQVRATGTHTVQIRLAHPMATFARSVAGLLPIIPKHIWSSIRVPERTRSESLDRLGSLSARFVLKRAGIVPL